MASVTDSQIHKARETDLFAYLQAYEPGVLKRDDPNYRHREHDSLVYVKGKRYWYWNSRGRSINTLDYLIQIRGYGFADAVNRLAGNDITPIQYHPTEGHSQKAERKNFALPYGKRCATSAISYLQRRGISGKVIANCLHQGLFYEAQYKCEPVCVFVGKDDTGKARFACMRSITGNMKKDVSGSDKRFSFCYPPTEPCSHRVAVFEAPIDCPVSRNIAGNAGLEMERLPPVLGRHFSCCTGFFFGAIPGNQAGHTSTWTMIWPGSPMPEKSKP